MPALLTSTSTGPSALSAASKNDSIDSAFATSSGCVKTLPPAAPAVAATSARRSSRRAPMATRQPSAAKATAVAAPTPEDAPVMKAVRVSLIASSRRDEERSCRAYSLGELDRQRREPAHVDGVDAA